VEEGKTGLRSKKQKRARQHLKVNEKQGEDASGKKGIKGAIAGRHAGGGGGETYLAQKQGGDGL